MVKLSLGEGSPLKQLFKLGVTQPPTRICQQRTLSTPRRSTHSL